MTSGEVLASTRERLLTAAQDLIEEGGYGAASVAAIAERAGVAAGTLYRHFESKQELFVEVFRAVCAREERAMRAASAQMASDAAAERLEEGGYGAASVAAIAERAGVAAGTLYRHFASKQELFVEVFRAVCAREERAMRAASAQMASDAAAERLEEVLATFAERALRNPRLAWALIAEPVDPLVDAERLAYRERYAEVIAEELRAGIEAGQLPDQDVELTAAALVGGCGEALVGPLSPVAGRRPSSEELVAALRTFVGRAVGAGA